MVAIPQFPQKADFRAKGENSGIERLAETPTNRGFLEFIPVLSCCMKDNGGEGVLHNHP